MKKIKTVIFGVLYYVLIVVTYMVFFYAVNFIMGLKFGFGTITFIAAMAIYVVTPVIIAILMRFSLLKWYVDPIAAAVIPLYLYLGMIRTRMERSGQGFEYAFEKVNESLARDGGEGWFFIIGLFAFGLVFSFSLARKKGKSISYRLLSRTEKKSDAESQAANQD